MRFEPWMAIDARTQEERRRQQIESLQQTIASLEAQLNAVREALSRLKPSA